MSSSMAAMMEEIVLIKQAAWKPPSKEELKTLAKDVGMKGLGVGIGMGGGYAVRKKLLPKLLKHVGPKSATALLYGGGALTGLLMSELYKRHAQRMDESRTSND